MWKTSVDREKRFVARLIELKIAAAVSNVHR
jgi:hypothetical protein